MIEILRSLPQGVYWYPLVVALIIVIGRTLYELSDRSARRRTVAGPGGNELAGWITLIERAGIDSYAEAELERHLLGLILQAAGYRRYSVDACRDYVERGASPEIAAIIREHLGDVARAPRTATGSLPARATILMNEIERMTEDT